MRAYKVDGGICLYDSHRLSLFLTYKCKNKMH